MKYARDQYQIVVHYADGVADILGLSTAQQLAIRTAMHLALRELAGGYESTAADMATQIELLRSELEEAESRQEQVASEQLAPLLATVSTNGTHPAEIRRPIVTEAPVITFVAAAAQEAASEAQPDPTTPAPAGENRRPAEYKWPTLDDVSLEVVQALQRKRRQWQSVTPDDKRIIVLALIGELAQDLPPGEKLSIETFNLHRPRWMPSFPSLSTGLGMTWKQMLAAAPQL